MDSLIEMLEAYLESLKNDSVSDKKMNNSNKNLLGDYSFAVILALFAAVLIKQSFMNYTNSKEAEKARLRGFSDDAFFLRSKTYKLSSFKNLSDKELLNLPSIKLHGQVIQNQRNRRIRRNKHFKMN